MECIIIFIKTYFFKGMAIFFAWFLYTRDSRNARFQRKADVYEDLSIKFAEVYLLRIKHDKFPQEHTEEYTDLYRSAFEYTLSHKLLLSEKISEISLVFLTSYNDPIDIMMNNLNLVLKQMRKELGYSVTDTLNQLTMIEPALSTLWGLTAKSKK